MGKIVATIAGVAKNTRKGSLTIDQRLTSDSDTCAFQVYNYKPDSHAEVIVTKDGVTLFGGYVINRESERATKGKRWWKVTCQDYTLLCYQRQVRNFNIEPDDIVWNSELLGVDPTTAGYSLTGTPTTSAVFDGWDIRTVGATGYYAKTISPDSLDTGFTVEFDMPRFIASASGTAGDHTAAWLECGGLKWRLQTAATKLQLNSEPPITVGVGDRVRLVVKRDTKEATLYVEGVQMLDGIAGESSSNNRVAFGDLSGSGTWEAVWSRVATHPTDTPPTPAGYIVKELVRLYAAPAAGLDVSLVQDGPYISSFTFDAGYLGDAIKALAALIKYEWDVDYNKRLKFFLAPATFAFEYFGKYGLPTGTHTGPDGSSVSNGFDSWTSSGGSWISGGDNIAIVKGSGGANFFQRDLSTSDLRRGFTLALKVPLVASSTGSTDIGTRLVLNGLAYKLTFTSTTFKLNSSSTVAYAADDSLLLVIQSNGTAAVYKNGTSVISGVSGTATTDTARLTFGDHANNSSTSNVEWFYLATANANAVFAPFTVTETDRHYFNFNVARDETAARNRITVIGGTRKVALVNYSIVADGINTVFPYPNGLLPIGARVEGQPRTLGKIGAGSFDFEIDEAGRILDTDPTGTNGPLPGGTNITLATYIERQVEVVCDDTTQQAALAAAGFSDGIIEATVIDESIKSNDAALKRGSVELYLSAIGRTKATFQTYTEGIEPGQVFFINKPLDEAVGYYLVYEVHLSFAGAGNKVLREVTLSPYSRELIDMLAALYDQLRKDARRIIKDDYPDNPQDVVPAIINLETHWVDATNFTVSFQTDKETDASVDHGPTTSYGANQTNGSLLKDHSLQLSGIDWDANPTYHFQITVEDADGNTTISEDFSRTRADFAAEEADWRATSAIGAQLTLLTGIGDGNGHNLKVGAGGVLDVKDALGASQGRQVKQAIRTREFTASHGDLVAFSGLLRDTGSALPAFVNAPKVIIFPLNAPSTLEEWAALNETTSQFEIVALDKAGSPGSTANDTSFGGAGEDPIASLDASNSSTTVQTGDAIVQASPGFDIASIGVTFKYTSQLHTTVFENKFGDPFEYPDAFGNATFAVRAGTKSGSSFTARGTTQTGSISWTSDGGEYFGYVSLTGLDSPSLQSTLWVKLDYYSESTPGLAGTFEITRLDITGVTSDVGVNSVRYFGIIIDFW